MDSKRISFFVWGEKVVKQKGSFVFFLCKTTFFSLPNSLWSDFLGFTPEKLLSILVIFIATLRGCAYYNTRNSLCSGLLQGERSKGHEKRNPSGVPQVHRDLRQLRSHIRDGIDP